MKKTSNFKQLKKILSLTLSVLFLFSLIVLFSNCDSSKKGYVANDLVLTSTASSGIDYTQSTPPPDIASQNEDASLTELAEFAWQEFVALNWPVARNGRGTPDTSQSNGFITASTVGGPTYTPVWQTYWHRNELFPATGKTPVKPATNDANKPVYQYDETYPYSGSGMGDYTLWNNLDEVNEIGEDVVYAHSTTASIDSTYQVLYEAKMNYDGSNYIYTANLNDPTTRNTLKTNTVNNISANGVCDAGSEYICLPCGDIASGNQGNIEIKAGWRQLDPTKDTIANYHTQEVIYYNNDATAGGTPTQVYKNVTMGLVGLHIIHKTKTFPDFVYATWEHKDNLSSDIVYVEIIETPFGDTAKEIKTIERVHPIPSEITDVNTMVSSYLNTQNSVWQNYKLINVQAKPMDVSELKGSRTAPENSSFYLSNSVIESNIELQTFTGSLTDSISKNVIYKSNKINMGGCMGCHGNAQKAGTDFNFLILGAPFGFPDFTGTPEPGCPTGGKAFPINTWTDVQKFFNQCVVQTTIGRSPHGEFWQQFGTDASKQEQNYCLFTTGDVPGVGIRICTPKDSTSSNIIDQLKGMNAGIERMPGGGPYFSSAQISELAKWIQNGCPYDAAGSYSYTDCN